MVDFNPNRHTDANAKLTDTNMKRAPKIFEHRNVGAAKEAHARHGKDSQQHKRGVEFWRGRMA